MMNDPAPKMTGGPGSASSAAYSQNQLREQLEAIGVKHGDHIALGVSFKKMGNISGGADAFIEATLETVGEMGTLMVNTYTDQFSLYRIRSGSVKQVFDHHSSPCNTGLIPEQIRRHPAALRSRHPVTSVAAIGQAADYLTRDHDTSAPPYSPYSKLAEIDGKYLAIGIGDRLAGFRHEAQYLAGLLDVVQKKTGARYLDDQGDVQLFVNRQPPGCITTITDLHQYLEEAGIVRRGRVGDAPSQLIPVRQALNIMTDTLRDHPEINLCRDVSCLWCRELERTLDLYPRIDKPRFFQRHRAVILAMALVNRIRMGDNPVLREVDRCLNLFRNPSSSKPD